MVRFRRNFYVRLTLFLLLFLLFLWLVYELEEPVEYKHVHFGKHNLCTHNKDVPYVSNYGRKKVILFYTTIFDRITVFYPEELDCCEPFNCEITTDRNRLLQSDAVIFHGRDLPKAKLMPTQRTAEQRWVFYTHESPFHSKIMPSDYNSMFNWTMTYERRADIYEPYGLYAKNLNIRNGKGLYFWQFDK